MNSPVKIPHSYDTLEEADAAFDMIEEVLIDLRGLHHDLGDRLSEAERTRLVDISNQICKLTGGKCGQELMEFMDAEKLKKLEVPEDYRLGTSEIPRPLTEAVVSAVVGLKSKFRAVWESIEDDSKLYIKSNPMCRTQELWYKGEIEHKFLFSFSPVEIKLLPEIWDTVSTGVVYPRQDIAAGGINPKVWHCLNLWASM